MENKKIGGGFLRYVLAEVYGYFSRGRGVKGQDYFKSLYLLCILMSIGGLGLLFYILGCGGRLDSLSLTLLGVGYLLFLFCVTDVIIIATSRSNL
jgi:hypothetical protein